MGNSFSQYTESESAASDGAGGREASACLRLVSPWTREARLEPTLEPNFATLRGAGREERVRAEEWAALSGSCAHRFHFEAPRAFVDDDDSSDDEEEVDGECSGQTCGDLRARMIDAFSARPVAPAHIPFSKIL